jgi:hypothetical protein
MPEPVVNRPTNPSPVGLSRQQQDLHEEKKRSACRWAGLSWRIATTAGPDMKSPSSSTTKTPSLKEPITGFIGAACLPSGGDIASRALRVQHRAPEVQFATNSPSRRLPWCSTMVVSAFMSPEIGTNLALTEATTPATRKP